MPLPSGGSMGDYQETAFMLARWRKDNQPRKTSTGGKGRSQLLFSIEQQSPHRMRRQATNLRSKFLLQNITGPLLHLKNQMRHFIAVDTVWPPHIEYLREHECIC